MFPIESSEIRLKSIEANQGVAEQPTVPVKRQRRSIRIRPPLIQSGNLSSPPLVARLRSVSCRRRTSILRKYRRLSITSSDTPTVAETVLTNPIVDPPLEPLSSTPPVTMDSVEGNDLSRNIFSFLESYSLSPPKVDPVVEAIEPAPLLSCLKRTSERVRSSSEQRHVSFGKMQVFYFERSQGFQGVPSVGGATLGMLSTHWSMDSLSSRELEEIQANRLRARIRRVSTSPGPKLEFTSSHCHTGDTRVIPEPVSPSSPLRTEGEGVSTVTESCDKGSMLTPLRAEQHDEPGSVCDFLQPLPILMRRKILKNGGVARVEQSEKHECDMIRKSRDQCGCSCPRGVCIPEHCECALAGVSCQVDRRGYPCSCLSVDHCSNPEGRTEFYPLRIKVHLFHTQMRLQMEDSSNKSHDPDDIFNSTEYGACKECSISGAVLEAVTLSTLQGHLQERPFVPRRPDPPLKEPLNVDQRPTFMRPVLQECRPAVAPICSPQPVSSLTSPDNMLSCPNVTSNDLIFKNHKSYTSKYENSITSTDKGTLVAMDSQAVTNSLLGAPTPSCNHGHHLITLETVRSLPEVHTVESSSLNKCLAVKSVKLWSEIASSTCNNDCPPVAMGSMMPPSISSTAGDTFSDNQNHMLPFIHAETMESQKSTLARKRSLTPLILNGSVKSICSHPSNSELSSYMQDEIPVSRGKISSILLSSANRNHSLSNTFSTDMKSSFELENPVLEVVDCGETVLSDLQSPMPNTCPSKCVQSSTTNNSATTEETSTDPNSVNYEQTCWVNPSSNLPRSTCSLFEKLSASFPSINPFV